ncbi:DNA ligase 1 [Lingula anatina]|uniref:DNA ligase 1 n=1 Tax=Lingula anatina TaxID=7574 RepID=A0A1S3KFX6_LINAN|nr:DNA ligase 1 [Lingula anatina]|eukprot:XP_013421392.1 DNA ligase 1 [Lingula anatina]
MGDEACAAETDAGGEEGERRNSPVKMKPPNKKKFEAELQSILTSIQEKEAQLKTLKDSSASEDNIHSRLRHTRAEKDASIERRKKIDLDLRALNHEISKKMDALTKVQATLHYRTEKRIHDAIGKLEHQLKTHNFKLSEERKIVAEIDSLRRSKKVLSQYLTQKAEIEEMRDRQRKMREERDSQFKIVTGLKSKEEEQRRTLSASRSKTETLKRELDQLYEQKRKIVSEFKKEEKDYNAERSEIRKKHRQESFKKREEERRAHAEAKQKEIEQYEATREPYENEKLMCSALITYLQRFLNPETRTETAGDVGVQENPSIVEEAEGMYVLRKRSTEEDTIPGGWKKQTSKRSKRDRKRAQNKPISHTPQTLTQFAALNLMAPAHTDEITASIEQLRARKKYYDHLPGPVRGEVRTLPDISVQEVEHHSLSSLPESADSNAFSYSRSISHTESEGSYEQPMCVTDLEESAEEGEKENGKEDPICSSFQASQGTEMLVENVVSECVGASGAAPLNATASQEEGTLSVGIEEPDCDSGPRSSTESTSSDSSHSTVTEHTAGDSPSHDASHDKSHGTPCDPLLIPQLTKSQVSRDKERHVIFKDSSDVIDPIEVDMVHEECCEEESKNVNKTVDGASGKTSPLVTSYSGHLPRKRREIESLQDIFDKLDFAELDGENNPSL